MVRAMGELFKKCDGHVKGMDTQNILDRMNRLQLECYDGALNTDFTNYDAT